MIMLRGGGSLVRTLGSSLSANCSNVTRAISDTNVGNRTLYTSAVVSSAQPAKPEKIEVFVDDIPVQVLPGTTVLQVYCTY